MATGCLPCDAAVAIAGCHPDGYSGSRRKPTLKRFQTLIIAIT
jgi:hypothetical protein